MNVTVIGGSGRTGRLVVEQLQQLGHRTTVLTRTPRDTGQVRGSIVDPPTVAAVVDGADGVVVVVESDDGGNGPNSPRRVHLDGIRNVLDATAPSARVALVSQIYITRPERLPAVRAVIDARRCAEELLRSSAQPYAIIRPGWLTDGPVGGVRLEQGDTGDGSVSRSAVAAASVAALVTPAHDRVTFEIFDDSTRPPSELSTQLLMLTPDEDRT